MTQHAVAFNTLAFAKKLETSGLETKYAESIAEAMNDVFEENFNDTLFTKEDGKLLKTELKMEITEVKSELTAEIAEVRAEIAGVKSELKAEIAEVRTEIAGVKSELKTEISELRSNMYKLKSDIIMWVIGLLFAQTAIMTSVIKFLH